VDADAEVSEACVAVSNRQAGGGSEPGRVHIDALQVIRYGRSDLRVAEHTSDVGLCRLVARVAQPPSRQPIARKDADIFLKLGGGHLIDGVVDGGRQNGRCRRRRDRADEPHEEYGNHSRPHRWSKVYLTKRSWRTAYAGSGVDE